MWHHVVFYRCHGQSVVGYAEDWLHLSGCLIKLLARLGFEYRNPKPLPKVAPADKRAEFIARHKRLITELSDDEAVYFADAVHPDCQTRPAFDRVKMSRSSSFIRNARAALSLRRGRPPLCQGSCPLLYFSSISQVGGIG